MKLNWNFQRGQGVLQKNPFCGGGMLLDIFWNYTLLYQSNADFVFVAWAAKIWSNHLVLTVKKFLHWPTTITWLAQKC